MVSLGFIVPNLLRAAASLTLEFANCRRHQWIGFPHLLPEHEAQSLSWNQFRLCCIGWVFGCFGVFFTLEKGGVWRRKEENLERKQQARLVWPGRGCDVWTRAVGNGLEPPQSICRMRAHRHLQSVLEADQGPEPKLPVIQALSPGLNSIFFTSHRMRLLCCSTAAQQWHPGAISFAVEISLLISKSTRTSAKTPLKELGKIPINVNNFWSICFTPWILAVSKRRALLPDYLCCCLFGWVI